MPTPADPKDLDEALVRIRALEVLLLTARADALHDFLGTLQVDGNEFYHNEANNYGAITVTIFTGEGDPDVFCGEEVLGEFRGGPRGTGRYRLNEALIPVLLKNIEYNQSPAKD